jgi:hypothetical protein
MTHPDPDLLALLALGEPVGTRDELDHIARCAECIRRLEEFTAAVSAGRAVDPADRLEQPSDRVWAGISATLGLAGPDGTAGDSGPPPEAGPEPAAAPVVPLAPRRSRRRGRATWLAVAAGLVVVGGVGTALVLGSLGPDRGDVLAKATLDALPAWPDAGGSAVVRETGGERILDVTVSPDTRPDSVREVWLISSDLTKLVSVGLLAADEGTFALPQDIDLSEYTVVDVSSEPLDGNPGHSSDSIVRGALRSA